jgi:hypothetical protein
LPRGVTLRQRSGNLLPAIVVHAAVIPLGVALPWFLPLDAH